MTAPRHQEETLLLRKILRTFGARPGVRLFRNSVGMVRLPGGGAIPYGLCPGSADLVGWRTVPTDLGPLARFVAIEVKAPEGRLTQEQERFIEVVRRAGGIGVVARSLSEADDALSALPPTGRR